MSDDHLDLRETSSLYVLGALSREESAAFESHIASCDACAEEVRSLRDMSAALPFAVPLTEPPAHLRDRVLAIALDKGGHNVAPFSPRTSVPATRTAASNRTGFWVGWMSAAALAVIAAGAGMYAVDIKQQLADAQVRLADATERLQSSQTQLAGARSDAAGVRASLALLTSPDALDLRLSGLPPAPRGRGRALLSPSRGLLFAATNLPPLPVARVYQLWVLTAGAPVSAGLVQPDAQGNVTASFDAPQAVSDAKGFAVSIEPEGGVPAPTGALYLATQ